eukprot:954979_1
MIQNDAPVTDQDLDDDLYAEEVLATKVLEKLDEMTHINSEDKYEPFFIFYALHLPQFDDDEGQSISGCEQTIQVSTLDKIIGKITDKLKGKDVTSINDPSPSADRQAEKRHVTDDIKK